MKVRLLSLIATVGTKYRSILRAEARYLSARERETERRKERGEKRREREKEAENRKAEQNERNKDERRFNFWLLEAADDVIFFAIRNSTICAEGYSRQPLNERLFDFQPKSTLAIFLAHMVVLLSRCRVIGNRFDWKSRVQHHSWSPSARLCARGRRGRRR